MARKLGYHPDLVASGLKRGRTQTVAVIVGDLGNPTIAPVLRGIANQLETSGLMSLICETQHDSERLERILNHVLSRRVDAIIITAARLSDASRLRRISRSGIPVVLALQNVPRLRVPTVTNDDKRGGILVAQHMLSLGHRRVAQLRGPDDVLACVERAQGFSKTVAAAGAVEVMVRSTAPTGTAAEGHALMTKLLSRKGAHPTGIFAHHDLIAYGALSAAEACGLICPRDLSMVGYHDVPHLERVVPPLTSIRQPREELGRIAAELTLEMIKAPDRPPAWRRVAPTLVVRESTGPPPERGRR
jgi:LacI family transcriptional regulator